MVWNVDLTIDLLLLIFKWFYIIQAFFLWFDTNYKQPLACGISLATSSKLNLKVRNLQRKSKHDILKPGCIVKLKYLRFTLLLYFLHFLILKSIYSFIAEGTNEPEEQNGIGRRCLSNTFQSCPYTEKTSVKWIARRREKTTEGELCSYVSLTLCHRQGVADYKFRECDLMLVSGETSNKQNKTKVWKNFLIFSAPTFQLQIFNTP